MRKRPGITLIEVLAAIFIMGVGMLAILVLFPLGALNMAKALQDDRCATIARNAGSLATAWDLRNDPTVTPLLGTGFAPGGPATAPGPYEPGYPVFVDPFYYVGLPGGTRDFLVSPRVRRVAPSYVQSINDCEKWFGFHDDWGFGINGYPNVGLGRQGRYTWAYMLRRKQAGSATSTEVSVIVYANRTVDVPVPEVAYSVGGATVGDTALLLAWPVGMEAPALRKGTWLFDSSPSASGRTVNAQFYRVMAVTESGANQLQVDVQPPLRHDGVSQMVFLPGAVEVYERGTGQ